MFIQTILRKQYEALDYLCLCVKTVCKEGKVVRYCNLNSPLKGLQNPWLLRSTGWIKRFLSLSFIDEGLAENWMMTEMMTEMMTPWTQQENSAVSTDDARRVQSQMTCWTETSRSFKICSQTDSASSFALRSTFFESGFVAVILTLLSLVLYSCCAASPAAGATASTTVLGKLLNCSPKLKLSYRHHHADKQFIHHSTCFPEHSTRFLEHSTRHVQQVSSTMTTILIVIDDHDTCFPIAFGLLYELSPESLKNFNISSRIKRKFCNDQNAWQNVWTISRKLDAMFKTMHFGWKGTILLSWIQWTILWLIDKTCRSCRRLLMTLNHFDGIRTFFKYAEESVELEWLRYEFLCILCPTGILRGFLSHISERLSHEEGASGRT